MAAIGTWFDKWRAEGKIGEGNAQLDSGHAARTIRGGAHGAVVVPDAPYIEVRPTIDTC